MNVVEQFLNREAVILVGDCGEELESVLTDMGLNPLTKRTYTNFEYLKCDIKKKYIYGEVLEAVCNKKIINAIDFLEAACENHQPRITLNIPECIANGQKFNIILDNGEPSVHNPYHFDGYDLFDKYERKFDIYRGRLIAGECTIELIKEPTELEKLEQDMRELAEKQQAEIQELADRIKEIKGE